MKQIKLNDTKNNSNGNRSEKDISIIWTIFKIETQEAAAVDIRRYMFI